MQAGEMGIKWTSGTKSLLGYQLPINTVQIVYCLHILEMINLRSQNKEPSFL